MDPDASFRVERRPHGDAVVVGPEGEIDLSTVDDVRAQLRAAAGEATTVVLDLSGVTFLDSTGLRMIVELQQDADRDRFAVVVVRAPEPVQRLLDIAGLSPRLALVDDVAEAVPRGRGDAT
jgi:anti-sigma B factor antagonist